MSQMFSRIQGNSAPFDVRRSIRTVLLQHPHLLESVRGAFPGFAALDRRYREQLQAERDAKWRLAAEVLATGRFRDIKLKSTDDPIVVQFWGNCDVRFVRGAQGLDGMDRDPNIDSEHVAAALSALKVYPSLVVSNRIAYASSSTREHGEATSTHAPSSHVCAEWAVFCARPAGWCDPRDPGTTDLAVLQGFGDVDLRTIMLYWCGGIMDRGAVQPIVPRPASRTRTLEDLLLDENWESRSLPAVTEFMSPSPKPLGAFDSDSGEEWDRVVFDWLEQIVIPGAEHVVEPAAVSRSRRASKAPRDRQKAAEIEARRDHVRTVYHRSGGKDWRMGIKALAVFSFKVGKTSWYTDLKHLDAEDPGWRVRNSDRNPSGLDDD